MPDAMLAAKLLTVSALLASVAFVHLRGRVRLRPGRQLTDHSTFTAPYTALMVAGSAVPSRPYLPLERFPELRPLVEHWKTLRDDALRLYHAGWLTDFDPRHDLAFHSLFRRGWRRFHLSWYGHALPSARALCPDSAALVESVPTLNAALFALLPAGARLGGHRDPFAGSLRVHVGLVVPPGDACRLLVDGIPYVWREGEAVVFDETFVHRAVNDGDGPRIVLFCDVDRPLRWAPLRALNRLVKRTVLAAAAARNRWDDPVGGVNRVWAHFAGVDERLRRIRQRHHGGWRVAKPILVVAFFALLLLRACT